MPEESKTTLETSESVNTSPAPEPATTTGGTVEEWDGHFEPPVFNPDDYDLIGESAKDAEPADEKDDSGREQKPEAQDTGDDAATAGPDESLKARATEAGLSETEIAAFKDDVAGLERTLNLIDRTSIRELRKAREAAAQKNGNGQPEEPVQQRQQQAPAAAADEDDFVPSDAWDEESRGELVKLHNHHKGRQEKLVSAIRSELQRRDEALLTQGNVLAGLVTELAIDGLGQDPLWKDVIANPENRKRIRDAALDLAAVQQQRGKPLDPANLYAQMREMVRRGATVEFGQDIEQQAIRKVRQQARDEATGRFTSTVPPQGRRGREPGDSREELYAKSSELDRRMGLT